MFLFAVKAIAIYAEKVHAVIVIETDFVRPVRLDIAAVQVCIPVK